MAKTFKQWYDKLPEESQTEVRRFCTKWIDLNEKDYMKHPKPTTEQILDSYEDAINHYNYESYLRKALMYSLLAIYKNSSKSKEERAEAYDKMKRLSKKDNSLQFFLEIEDIRKQVKERKADGYSYDVDDILLTTEDFDNINWNLLLNGGRTYNIPTFNARNCNFLSKEFVINTCKEYPELCLKSTPQDVFDTLFFGEDGWTDIQKDQVLRTRYDNTTEGIKDFLLEVVTVDKSYLRFLPTFFTGSRNTAMASILYREKKPDDEMPENKTMENIYRFPKEYRRLFQMAACCVRKNIGKAMAGTLGQDAALLRFFNYDFDTTFKSLYPELFEDEDLIGNDEQDALTN